MKTCFTLLFLICTLLTHAQIKKNTISVYTDIELESENFTYYGLSYERKISKNHGLAIFTAISKQENISLGMEYSYNRKIFSNYLSVLLGGGVGMEYHSNESSLGKNNYFLFRPLLGLDFKIPNTELEIFTAYKPKFDLQKFNTFDVSTMIFGVKYNL